MLKEVILRVNYPDAECDAAIPSDMTVEQLGQFIRKLIETEPDATSFVLTAVIAH